MKKFVLFFAFFLLFDFCSATHSVVGYVGDAKDGTLAENSTIFLWNPANGINDNLTDLVGVNGNSGVDNSYMFDCELLSVGCNIGDEIRVEIFGDYPTGYVSTYVTGAGFDIMNNLSLNSPPVVNLSFPEDLSSVNSSNVELNCSYFDLDSNLFNVTLYGDWDGWHAEETKSIFENGSSIFDVVFGEGNFSWNCLVSDVFGISTYASENFSFSVDLTKPVISSIVVNDSHVCGNTNVRVNCSTFDNFSGIDEVVVRARNFESEQNYSAIFLEGDTYYADIFLSKVGEWNISCIVSDNTGNIALSSIIFDEYSDSADLIVDSVFFDELDPVEGQGVFVNATLHNQGCLSADDFLVGFYNGDPDVLGVQIGENQTISIPGFSSFNVNLTWKAEIGISELFVLADVDDSVSEYNDSNNKNSSVISVGSWQEFYGNISGDKILSSSFSFNMSAWFNESSFGGNIFVSDSESDINWFALQAIGRAVDNSTASNDFSDIDDLLGMNFFKDSVSDIFQNKTYSSFVVNKRTISNVPVVNSTFNSDFVTGVLWDMDDDIDGEFSQADKEDLVFVTNVQMGNQGAYGNYDYELKIPVRLREYYSADTTDVYLYYDLV